MDKAEDAGNLRLTTLRGALWCCAILVGASIASARAEDAQGTQGAQGRTTPAIGIASLEGLDETDQRSRVVDRRLELVEEDLARARSTAAVPAAGEKGFSLKSADGRWAFKAQGLIHVDGRFFLDDTVAARRDTFLVRRARPLLEASFADLVDFRLMPDFGGGQVVVQDAYIDLHPWSYFRLRGGKFKPPVGFERLQSASAIVFPERALPSALAPNRDVGFMLHGLLAGVVTYEAGVWNGVVDGALGDVDSNHAKDFGGRIFLSPWKNDPFHPLSNLGVGLAASTGAQRGTEAAFQGTRRTASSTPQLPVFRSAGQQQIFQYVVNDDAPGATVIAQGRRTRFAPHLYGSHGGLALLAEYVQSRQRVEIGTSAAELTHRAYQVQASWILGGKALYEGAMVWRALDLGQGTWGALELALRYNALALDAATFPTFADPGRAVKRIDAVGAVASWHWSKQVKLSLAFEHSRFEGGAGAEDRLPENVLFQRLAASF